MKSINMIYLCCLIIIMAACEKDMDAIHFAPEVTTGIASDIYRKGATLSGKIQITGTSTVESYGILFSKLKNMEERTEYSITTGKTEYEIDVQNLEPGTNYYFCAYANSGFSTRIGEIKSFTTTENNPPVFSDLSIDSIKADRVYLSANIIDNGGAELLVSGFCWKEGNSGVATYIDNVINVSEVQNNRISTIIKGLKPESSYVISAYSVNTNGMGFSESLIVTTNKPEKPIFSYIIPTDSTNFSVTLSAKIYAAGSEKLEKVGFVWSNTNQNPVLQTQSNTQDSTLEYCELTDQLEKEEFSTTLEDLKPSSTYYIRAYAVNEAGEGYSEVYTFTTAEAKTSTLSAVEVKDSTSFSVTLETKIIDTGTTAITQAGFCWSVSNDAPTIEDDSNDLTSQLTDGNMSLSTTFSDLEANTTYYIRAYAINAEGVSYSEVYTFTTAEAKTPTLSVVEVKDSTSLSVTLETKIIDTGTTAITQAGFCWSVSNDAPTIEDDSNDLTSQLTDGNMSLSTTFSDLKANSTYYIRAYAINAEGVSYSEVFEFTTASPKTPTLSTITVKDSTDVFITLEATIINKGSSELLKVGFCWGTANEPTINNSYYNDLTSQLENDNLKLISTLSVGDSFKENDTYYIRAYATNDIGTSYSDTFIFRTGFKDVKNEITIGGGEMVIW